MAKRITKKYVPGSGDMGYSTVLQGHHLRKDSAACKIQGSIELMRHKIEDLLCDSLLQEDLVYLLNYLDRNIFSLASFCYLKADSTKHQLPAELLEFLNERTKELKNILGDCRDFMSQSHPTLVKLDGVRIEVRQLESAYTAWRYSSEITLQSVVSPTTIDAMNSQAAILNRLSAYLFEATRLEAKLLKESGCQITPFYWQSEVEEFELPNSQFEQLLLPLD